MRRADYPTAILGISQEPLFFQNRFKPYEFTRHKTEERGTLEVQTIISGSSNFRNYADSLISSLSIFGVPCGNPIRVASLEN